MTSTTTGIMVRMKHIRQAGVCAAGARPWFARYGLDFAVFVRDGLPVEQIESTGHHVAAEVAVFARKDSADG